MTVQCIYRGGCMHAEACTDHCKAGVTTERNPPQASKQCCHDPLDGRFTMKVAYDAKANYVGITCSACGHGLHIPMPESSGETTDERGKVTIVTNTAGECVAVTRTGPEHEVLSVIWERSAVKTNGDAP